MFFKNIVTNFKNFVKFFVNLHYELAQQKTGITEIAMPIFVIISVFYAFNEAIKSRIAFS